MANQYLWGVSYDETGGGGIVGDAGEVFMPGLKPEGMLKVVWGHSASQQCMATYQLEKRQKSAVSAIHMLSVCK